MARAAQRRPQHPLPLPLAPKPSATSALAAGVAHAAKVVARARAVKAVVTAVAVVAASATDNEMANATVSVVRFARAHAKAGAANVTAKCVKTPVLNAVNHAVKVVAKVGDALRTVQTGRVRAYVLVMALTVLGLLGMLFAFTR